MRKYTLLLGLSIFILLFAFTIPVSGQPNVATNITVNNADEVKDISVSVDGSLVDILEGVLEHIVVQYAKSNRKEVLAKVPSAFQDLLNRVSERVVFQYANSSERESLIYPIELIDDTTPPQISDISTQNVSESKVLVTWMTDEFTTSKINYGTEPGIYTKSVSDSLYNKEHQLSLINLTTGITYYYQVRAVDLSGNTAVSSEQSFAIPIEPTFADVPLDHWAYDFIEAIYRAGITAGCSTDPLMYCPDATVTRAEMAVFLENGIHYPDDYSPPDVSPSFDDTAGHWAEDWIEALYSGGITAGCSTDPLRYCPDSGTTRAQMAVFLLKSKHGGSYAPPDVEPTFDDTAGHWAEDWIEQLYSEGITAGCGGGNYCPESPVTRAQMAVFLTRTFNLPMP